MKENVLPKKTCLLWQIRFAAASIILCAASGFLCFISSWFLILVGVIAAAGLIMLLWYLPHYFASYEILLPNGAIIINRGIFIKTTHIMPFSKLVYVQSLSTPLAKSFGLAAISLKAARSNLLIPEIDEDDVNAFISSITREEDT